MTGPNREKQAKIFSERLMGARGNRRLSQAELAREVGVSLRQVQHWEAGTHLPRGRAFRRLCEVLETSGDYLFGSEGAQAGGEIRDKCRSHMDAFLDRCRGDADKLGWTYFELRTRFPLDKWDRLEGAQNGRKQALSAEAVEQLGDLDEVDALADTARKRATPRRGAPSSSPKAQSSPKGDPSKEQRAG